MSYFSPIKTSTGDGNYEDPIDLDYEKSEEIRTICEKGSVHQLETILSSLEPAKLARYLNTTTENKRSDLESSFTGVFVELSFLTPLMVASRHGQETIVRFLLENYHQYCEIDAQCYSSDYDIDYEMYTELSFYHQTALWLAVKFQHFEVVRTLIVLGHANVNHKADELHRSTRMTPIGLACIDGHLEMVKCLIENGADLYNAGADGSTSLMMASACGHYDIIQYLLSLDDSSNRLLNAINNRGSTALHTATYGKEAYCYSESSREEANQELDIVKLFLEEHQAKVVKDNEGHTPLAIAGIKRNDELVEYFIGNEENAWLTHSQMIDDLELIASYHLRWSSEPVDLKRPYYYLQLAMRLKYSDPEAPIRKTGLLPPIAAYQYYTECQTMEELESIKDNRDRLAIEGLLIHERAGVTCDLLHSLARQGDFYISIEEYSHALHLYLHGYHLRIETQIDLSNCKFIFRRCVNTMYGMICDGKTKRIPFDLLMTLLRAMGDEFLRNENSTKQHDEEECLSMIIDLLVIGSEILASSEENKQERRRLLLQQVQQYIDSDWRTKREKKSLLHLSLMEYRDYGHLRYDFCIKLPDLSVVDILLACRAPINAIDGDHNTPLHQFVANEFEDFSTEDFNEMEMIFQLLVNNGAHLDAIAQGQTPADCARHESIQNLFRRQPIQLNLKCICARMIQRERLNYTNCVSKHLHAFVQLH